MTTRRFLKIFFSLALFGSLLVMPLASAAPSSPLARFAKDTILSFEVALTGKLKDIVQNFISKIEEQGGAPETGTPERVMYDKVKAGGPFYVGIGGLGPFGVGEGSVMLIIEATAEEFETFKQDAAATETYEGIEIAMNEENQSYAFFADSHISMTKTLESAKESIDLIKGKTAESLLTNPNYQFVATHFPTKKNVSFFLDGEKLFGLLQSAFGQIPPPEELKEADPETDTSIDMKVVPTPPIATPFGPFSPEKMAKLMKAIGFSVGETARGYDFGFTMASDAAFLQENHIKLIPGGLFTPSLYEKFPAARVLYYSEQYNFKAGLDQNENLMKALFGESFTDQGGLFSTQMMIEELEKEVEIDLDPLISSLDRELAFSVQDYGEIFPMITVMANVSTDPAGSKKTVADLSDAMFEALQKESPEAVRKTSQKFGKSTFSAIDIDVTDLKDFDGPPFPNVRVIMGVTDDDTLIIAVGSNKAVRNFDYGEGLSQDPDFSAAFANRTAKVASIGYLNIRGIIQWVDRMFDWGLTVGAPGGNAPPLESLRDYFTFIDFVYGAKDLFAVSTTTNEESVVNFTGSLSFDSAKHVSFEDFVGKYEDQDSDGDGLTDHEEIQILSTDPKNADTDGDGASDKAEVDAKTDPRGLISSFKDLKEQEWYAPEVSELAARKVVKGYDDKTFKPGNLVTRAEFTCMATRAFEADLGNFLGFDSGLDAGLSKGASLFGGETGFGPIFSDVSADAWFADCVKDAAAAGFVAGYNDGTFRPLDPIKRAEAIAILTKMNKTLGQALQEAMGNEVAVELPFQDVSRDQWFHPYVAAAYEKEVALGKSADRFDPLGLLRRAEAAVMIKRALDVELTYIEAPTSKPETSALAPLLQQSLKF